MVMGKLMTLHPPTRNETTAGEEIWTWKSKLQRF
jgi:hypothetical protein